MDDYDEIEGHSTSGVLKHLLPWRAFLSVNSGAGHMADQPGKALWLKRQDDHPSSKWIYSQSGNSPSMFV